VTTIGILGAGKLGTVLAALSVAAGYRTLVAGSGNPDRIELILQVLSPGAEAVWQVDVAREADIIILALPLGKHRMIRARDLAGRIVIDAMNYWPPTDGVLPEFEAGQSSTLVVSGAFPGARLVKALSHIGYHELQDDGRPAGSSDRHAIAVAGDDAEAVWRVSDFIEAIGFDPVVVGPLQDGRLFGPGTTLFGASLTAGELRRRIDLSP
jgi:predicted dinucleotide-binding enzyme